MHFIFYQVYNFKFGNVTMRIKDRLSFKKIDIKLAKYKLYKSGDKMTIFKRFIHYKCKRTL